MQTRLGQLCKNIGKNYGILKYSMKGMLLSGRAFALHVKGPGFNPRHLQSCVLKTKAISVFASSNQDIYSFNMFSPLPYYESNRPN